MIWSYKELANLAIMGENAIVERVMKHLGDRENQDIFAEENFSYLWGALGIVGIKGVDENVIPKIWRVLRENGVLRAFDNGVLGDFNLEMIKKYSDNRLRGWQNYDNFTADQRFKKIILMPIVSVNRKYAEEVDVQAFNPLRVLGVLERYPMSDAIKLMLKNVHGYGAACGIWGKEVIEHYEKEKILNKLCDIIAHSKRVLHEDEKDFLFRYIQEAVIDGFLPENIGLRDEVFAGLMANKEDMEGMSELEISRLRERNAEIVDFAKEFDGKLGFFEKSAVKLIKYNPAHTQEMIDRCISLMNRSDPKGVLFALELINLKQIKSGVKILIELAKRGRATEAVLFLHRLMPYVKGSETMIMSILKLNLKVLKEKRDNGNDNVFFREYPARVYVTAVKVLEEFGFYRDAGVLLTELVTGDWVIGIKDLEEECVIVANQLLTRHKDLENTFRLIANKLKLKMFRNDKEVYILYGSNIGNNGGIRKTYERFLHEIKDISKKVDISKVIEKNIELEKTVPVDVNKKEKIFEENIVSLESKASIAQTQNIVEDDGLDSSIEENYQNVGDNVFEEENFEENAVVSDENEFVVGFNEEDDEYFASENVVDEFDGAEFEDNESVDFVEDEFENKESIDFAINESIEFVEDDFINANDTKEEDIFESEESLENIEQQDIIPVGDNGEVANDIFDDDDTFLNEDVYGQSDDELKGLDNLLNKPIEDDFSGIFGNTDKKSDESADLVDSTSDTYEYTSLEQEDVAVIKEVELDEEDRKIVQWENENLKDDENKEKDLRAKVNNLLNINARDIDKHFDKIKEITSNAIKKVEGNDAKFDKIREITSNVVKRVDGMEKHFDRIKVITNDMVKKAEDKALKIKQRVDEKDIENSKAVSAFKKVTEKIRGFRKKQ